MSFSIKFLIQLEDATSFFKLSIIQKRCSIKNALTKNRYQKKKDKKKIKKKKKKTTTKLKTIYVTCLPMPFLKHNGTVDNCSNLNHFLQFLNTE